MLLKSKPSKPGLSSAQFRIWRVSAFESKHDALGVWFVFLRSNTKLVLLCDKAKWQS